MTCKKLGDLSKTSSGETTFLDDNLTDEMSLSGESKVVFFFILIRRSPLGTILILPDVWSMTVLASFVVEVSQKTFRNGAKKHIQNKNQYRTRIFVLFCFSL
jgi:hypothetical protein